MDIWNADKLTLFLVFFLPGFISIKVYDLMVPGERRDFSKSLLEAISYSTLNFAALFWLIAVIQNGNFYRSHFVLYSLSVAIIMVGVPACWPFLFSGFQLGGLLPSTSYTRYESLGTTCLGSVNRTG